MINLFLRLFAAHLVAEFFLQFDCINKGKYRRGISGFSFLFLHGFIHAIVTYLFLAQWDNWFIPLFIFITHMLTDWAKVVFTNRFCAKPQNGRVVPFLLDQFLHVSFLILVVCCYYWMWGQFPTSKVFFATDSCNKYWLVAISYLLVLKPSGLLIVKAGTSFLCPVFIRISIEKALFFVQAKCVFSIAHTYQPQSLRQAHY